MTEVRLIAVEGIGEVSPGDDLVAVVLSGTPRPEPGDVVVVAQKIVSKAEGRLVAINEKDPLSHKPLVFQEARRVVRRRENLLITENRHGLVSANAGVDRSNVPDGYALLLPLDSDRSANRLCVGLEREVGGPLGVVITDTLGRAWRRGHADHAIGVSGLPAIVDLKGTHDHNGKELLVTEMAVADEIAGAAELVMGKANKVPVALVRGTGLVPGQGKAADLVRDPREDLFR